eukprot:9259059-Pyramimonas_sp.AAC.1
MKTTSGPNLAGASLENDARGALSRTEDGQFTNRRVRVGVLSTPESMGGERGALLKPQRAPSGALQSTVSVALPSYLSIAP